MSSKPGGDSLMPDSLTIVKPFPPPNAPCPDCFVTQICGPYRWTNWMDRDNPGGTGDWETVVDNVVNGGCPNPIWVECTTTAGVPWWKTGEKVRFSTTGGCVCYGQDNPPNFKCKNDYMIRELCP
jgi:hypothetical protein